LYTVDELFSSICWQESEDPVQTQEQGVRITPILYAGSRQEIGANHLQTVAPGLRGDEPEFLYHVE
jgi:hypothetical protein